MLSRSRHLLFRSVPFALALGGAFSCDGTPADGPELTEATGGRPTAPSASGGVAGDTASGGVPSGGRGAGATGGGSASGGRTGGGSASGGMPGGGSASGGMPSEATGGEGGWPGGMGGEDTQLGGAPGTDVADLWQVQFGGEGNEDITGVALHPSGDVIVAGATDSSLAGRSKGDFDGFIRRMSSVDGSEVWTVQFGTSFGETTAGVVVDESGDIYVAGTTAVDMAGTGALGRADVFLLKFAGADGRILWRRQFGTDNDDGATRLISGGNGVLVLTGSTTGDLGNMHGAFDAFVATLRMSDGSDIWIHQFGSTDHDAATDVALDPNGDLVVAGWTQGLMGAESFGSDDAFVAKFSSEGSPLWSTQFGSDAMDGISGVATDAAGMVYAAGVTQGDLDGDGPETHHGSYDAMLQALDGETGALGWLSQYGGEGEDHATAVVVREGRDIVSVGYSPSSAAYPFAHSAVARAASSNDGSELWRVTYPAAEVVPYVVSEFSAVMVDPQGTLTLAGHCAGNVFGPNAGYNDVIVVRLRP